jgi:hypothetical protein
VEQNEVENRLKIALGKLAENDGYLLENDLSERCIASRLAMYLQEQFREYSVDVEYNRDARAPKELFLPPECANHPPGKPRKVLPDIIVHRRGGQGPNVLVLEMKKGTNYDRRDCDRKRVRAFQRPPFNYEFGALIKCWTDAGAGALIDHEWVPRTENHA